MGHHPPRGQNLDVGRISHRALDTRERFWNPIILRARARRSRTRTRSRRRPQTPQLRRWEGHREIPAASGWRALTSPSIWPRETSFSRALFTISGGKNSTWRAGRQTSIADSGEGDVPRLPSAGEKTFTTCAPLTRPPPGSRQAPARRIPP